MSVIEYNIQRENDSDFNHIKIGCVIFILFEQKRFKFNAMYGIPCISITESVKNEILCGKDFESGINWHQYTSKRSI